MTKRPTIRVIFEKGAESRSVHSLIILIRIIGVSFFFSLQHTIKLPYIVYKMKFLRALSLPVIATLLALVSADEATADPNSAVVKLTADTFSSFLNENPLVLAEFFAPWCGHCKALGPNFASAADALDPKDIKLAQIDCTEEEQLCQSQGIRGYPTLKVFRGSAENPSDYEGPRSSDGIISYMSKQALPAVSVIEATDDLNDFLADNEVVVVETGVKNNETFYEVANLNRDEQSFVQTQNTDFVSKYGKDKVLIFLSGSEEPAVFQGDSSDSAELTKWLKVESVPFFGELDGSTYQKYASAELPLAYLFYSTPEERESYQDVIVKLAKESRGKLNFVGLDGSKFGRHAENLNIQQEFPAFVIHDLVSNKKYAIPQDSALSTEKVEDFFKKYSNGEIEAVVKSEEIPEVQESAVYKIVGKTHDDIIGDESKDVLVEYYAPWCGHCKKLAPIYEELAALYESDQSAKGKVRIAHVDATLNDLSVEITGYPTLILYPAGDKSNPIVHSSGRDLASLITFIKEKGTFGIDGNGIEAPAKENVAKDAGHDEL